jgi:hypothetical protein
LKSFLFWIYAVCYSKIFFARNPLKSQKKTLSKIIQNLNATQYQKAFSEDLIVNSEDFFSKIPVSDYENLQPFIEKILNGDQNVFCQNSIKYMLLSSGTTSGAKYIPITKEGISYQIRGAKLVLILYALHKKNASFMKHFMIFLQGSPQLDIQNSIPAGRLSGVVYHEVPKFFQKNKLPSYEVNIIEDWILKINAIVDETKNKNISIIGGIPPWCIQYFEALLKATHSDSLKSIYPNLELYIHGGVDFMPYRTKIKKLLGKEVDCLDTFPASEGFFAIQDHPLAKDMLLLTDNGIYYEFRENGQSEVITLEDVRMNVVYELIISNLSGFYRYTMGDLIRFTSVSPYRIQVVGRTQHFISAFGEHVIAHHIETTMSNFLDFSNLDIIDFHVCPDVSSKQYLWLIEAELIEEIEINKEAYETFLDLELSKINSYYQHLIEGQIIQRCRIVWLQSGSFETYRIKNQKLGAQNKVVHLSNNMDIGTWFLDRI